MAGNKNSGRRPLGVRMNRLRVIDKAWEVTQEKLESQDKDRVQAALPIVIKSMVDHKEIEAHVVTQEEQGILDKYIHTNRLLSTE